MLVQYPDGYYRSDTVFLSDVCYGFSSRQHGDMREFINRERVFRQFQIAMNSTVFTRQVHGSTVSVAGISDLGSTIPGADGLVYKDYGCVGLGVFGADCLPIVATGYTTERVRVVGGVHAGWKGIFQGVIPAFITTLAAQGIPVENMKFVIGPHIRSCCYDVSSERANLAIKLFGSGSVTVYKDRNLLDLTIIAMQQFEQAGVDLRNIDSDTPCTSCSPDIFFSFRRTREHFGEIMGFIGKKE